jgi:hypothetical protein
VMQTQTEQSVCVSVSEQFYTADRLAYEMDFAGAESGYLQLQAYLRANPDAGTCADTPIDARLTARIANVQSAQLQFLSASDLLRRAQAAAADVQGAEADLDREELSNIAFIDQLNRVTMAGGEALDASSGVEPFT